MIDKKYMYVHDDVLPCSIDELIAKVKDKPKKFNIEDVKAIADCEYFHMSDDEKVKVLYKILDNLDNKDDYKNIDLSMINNAQPQFAYAESLDKEDELNQDFPEVDK